MKTYSNPGNWKKAFMMLPTLVPSSYVKIGKFIWLKDVPVVNNCMYVWILNAATALLCFYSYGPAQQLRNLFASTNFKLYWYIKSLLAHRNVKHQWKAPDMENYIGCSKLSFIFLQPVPLYCNSNCPVVIYLELSPLCFEPVHIGIY